MMDRYHLRYFLAVVDHGNFSRAAAHCNVAQPTLSVGIAKLESALGTKLFVRTNQRVELTVAGARFLNFARRIEGEFNAAQRAMAQTAPAALFRVGVLGSIPGALIARAVAASLAVDPSLRIEIVDGSERELSAHVARGRVDCAVTLIDRGSDRFEEELLFEEGYALALWADHPRAAEAVVQGEDLAADTMIVRRHCEALGETSRHFTERGVRPRFSYRSNNDERVLALVAAGLGITIMPDCFEAPAVVRSRLSGFTLRRKIGVAYTLESHASGVSTHPFLQTLRGMAPALNV
ncbi:LysR family transcriptional regulator [Novosphingobium colocasiae]|uniref:LysR family transcriptional regulator n=1 Tax=Novosphingobium colocasiae TaxID=1256513 RepID=UPI0035B0E738